MQFRPLMKNSRPYVYYLLNSRVIPIIQDVSLGFRIVKAPALKRRCHLQQQDRC